MNKVITSILIISIFGFQNISAMAGGVNPDQQLLQGAENNNLAQVEDALAQGANVNAVGATLMTALNWAVEKNNYVMVSYLLERGADPNIANVNGNTPLHNSMFAMRPASILKLLLDKGADPTLRNNLNRTPADVLKSELAEQDVLHMVGIITPDQFKKAMEKGKLMQRYLEEAVHSMPEVRQPMSETATT